MNYSKMTKAQLIAIINGEDPSVPKTKNLFAFTPKAEVYFMARMICDPKCVENRLPEIEKGTVVRRYIKDGEKQYVVSVVGRAHNYCTTINEEELFANEQAAYDSALEKIKEEDEYRRRQALVRTVSQELYRGNLNEETIDKIRQEGDDLYKQFLAEVRSSFVTSTEYALERVNSRMEDFNIAQNDLRDMSSHIKEVIRKVTSYNALIKHKYLDKEPIDLTDTLDKARALFATIIEKYFTL
ncbi:MAG: hypothetical protein NC218_01995 [Acetobacter sp.]|nr:hypothetical protein [Acetobacter sp.]